MRFLSVPVSDVVAGVLPVVSNVATAATMATGWVAANPVPAAAIASTTAVMIFPAIVSPILSAIGFTPQGVAARSVAAGIQSSTGNVAAGSIFAAAQSAAAGGGGIAVINWIVQGVVAGVAGIASGVAWLTR
ncbi:hypothetical protein MPDQ_007782 [Monascus purpureus]|uniref:Uncharacterized protein n=1 Tax=Monascus purpureus TaxID=5098 RepID=A0A507QRB3_MONPU|nr:hypothetical protein MPDQ_007782 [Monascus purpureus]BDD57577.1 hypothetical protein MAP00_002930 [Monascus purpureus]